jgi:hypothetical protein
VGHALRGAEKLRFACSRAGEREVFVSLLVRNPKIDGEEHPFLDLIRDIDRKNPSVCRVYGTIPVPDWEGIRNHFQGIAPKNDSTEITGAMSASASEWWAASFVQKGNTGTVEHVWFTGTYDHAGGIQRLGDLLPIGLENDNGLATVAFYDVSNPAAASLLYEVHIAGKASAVAIANYRDANRDNFAMMLVYQYDPRIFQVFRVPLDDIGNAAAWQHVTDTNVIPDQDDDDQYQCFALATQANGFNADTLYLIGFRENEAAVVYTVSIEPDTFGHLTFAEAFRGWEGAEWRYGAGLQICSESAVRVFGCSEDPSGDSNDYEFPIYYWS